MPHKIPIQTPTLSSANMRVESKLRNMLFLPEHSISPSDLSHKASPAAAHKYARAGNLLAGDAALITVLAHAALIPRRDLGHCSESAFISVAYRG
jgi:hypothetical protein